MKLLLDENLPPRLLASLSPHFPESAHVRDVGLASAPDLAIWDYARENGFCLISKDSDFQQLGFLRGFPPKVIRIRLGNCSTDQLETLALASLELIERFEKDPHASVLILG